jgi:Domain of Unknown Function (DUF1080)
LQLHQLVILISFPAALLAQSSRESKGWVPLFDGKTMDHWNDPRKLNPPGDSWTVEDGCLKTGSKPRITEDLVSTEAYGDFELQWEWKIAKGGNSGLKYRCQAFPVLVTSAGHARFEDTVQAALEKKLFDRSLIPGDGKAQIYNVGFEYQMIDNANHADAKRGGLYQTGALYSIVPPTTDASKPVGEFNESRLVVRGYHFEHWLNGQKVMDITATPEMLRHALEKRWGAQSEVVRLLSEQPKTQCPIALQNHGDEAWFRNIKIRQLQ